MCILIVHVYTVLIVLSKLVITLYEPPIPITTMGWDATNGNYFGQNLYRRTGTKYLEGCYEFSLKSF